MKKLKEIQIDIGGKDFIITSDDDYLTQINKSFEPDMVALFKILASNSEVILDIGANIGCTALLFGELAKKVYAFEPSPSTFSLLDKNVSKAKAGNIFPQNCGLGSEGGETTLTFSPSNRSGGFVSNQTQASSGHTVEKIIIKQLDEVVSSLKLNNIDFIKIDVEGFEGHVLRGAKQTLIDNKPAVVLELNHWCLNAFQRTSVPDFFDLLRSIFPIIYAVDGNNYLNLHDENESYLVMYHHILQMRFPNIVAGFDEKKFDQFKATYDHGLNKKTNK